MSRTDFLRKDPLAGDVATEHRGRKGRRPVGDYDRSLLGPLPGRCPLVHRLAQLPMKDQAERYPSKSSLIP